MLQNTDSHHLLHSTRFLPGVKSVPFKLIKINFVIDKFRCFSGNPCIQETLKQHCI